MIAGLRKGGVGVGPEQRRVGAVDSDEPQLAQGLGYGVGVLAHVGRERHLRIAGSLADAPDTGGGVTFENGTVFGKGDLARGVLRRLPVRVICAAVNVVDHLAIQLEWNTQLDQSFHLALSCDAAALRSRGRSKVAGADGGETRARWTLHVNQAASGEVALEGARGFFFYRSPRP